MAKYVLHDFIIGLKSILQRKGIVLGKFLLRKGNLDEKPNFMHARGFDIALNWPIEYLPIEDAVELLSLDL